MEIEDFRKLVEDFMTPEVLREAALSNKEAALKEWIRGGLRGISCIDTGSAKIACTEICTRYGASMSPELENLVFSICDKKTSDAEKDSKIDQIVEIVFSLGGEAALGEFVNAMWKGINKLDDDKAHIVCKHTCVCYDVMMPPGWEDVINSVYDRNNPDVDKALTIQGIIEYVTAKMEGDRFSIHRKGNKATVVLGEKKCLCPYVYEYHVVEPSPAQCHEIHHMYPKAYLKLYNIPLKARIIETFGRGDSRCAVELEFPEELIKTPEFKFP